MKQNEYFLRLHCKNLSPRIFRGTHVGGESPKKLGVGTERYFIKGSPKPNTVCLEAQNWLLGVNPKSSGKYLKISKLEHIISNS